MITGDVGYCTAGFVARRNSDGAPVILTAGHCLRSDPGHTETDEVATWSAPNGSNQWKVINALSDKIISRVDKDGDFGYVQINGKLTWRKSKSNIIRVYSDPNAGTTRDPHYRINDVRYSPNPDKRKNFVLCMTGTNPFQGSAVNFDIKQRCGKLKRLGFSGKFKTVNSRIGHLGVIDVCVNGQGGIAPGNSGGPVYKDHVAYGLIAGADDDGCTVYYSSARGAERALGVRIRRG
ncbi:MAG: S1 family peptidase [Solirubrobacteraceae bacterium]|nr:S1 family peptidase [Solirubrobacteraceae bacterium]